MNWEFVHAEGLRMCTGLKLVNYSKCSGLAVSALPDHTSSFFSSQFNKNASVLFGIRCILTVAYATQRF